MKNKAEIKTEDKDIEIKRTFTRDVNVPRSGTFFNFKIITLKEIQERNNQPLRNKL